MGQWLAGTPAEWADSPTRSSEAVRYRFANYCLCAQQRKLWRNDQTVPLTSRALDVLLALVRSPGRVVSREELLRRVWGSVSVQDSNLTVNLCLLRRALGPDQDFIVTLPGRGYQFVESVIPERIPAALAPQPAATLAVREFTRLGDTRAYRSLGEALPPVLLAALSSRRDVRLLPLSAQAARNSARADWVLEGSFQQEDQTVRVTAQLVAGSSGDVVWADHEDFPALPAFELQDRIAAWLQSGLRFPAPAFSAAN